MDQEQAFMTAGLLAGCGGIVVPLLGVVSHRIARRNDTLAQWRSSPWIALAIGCLLLMVVVLLLPMIPPQYRLVRVLMILGVPGIVGVAVLAVRSYRLVAHRGPLPQWLILLWVAPVLVVLCLWTFAYVLLLLTSVREAFERTFTPLLPLGACAMIGVPVLAICSYRIAKRNGRTHEWRGLPWVGLMLAILWSLATLPLPDAPNSLRGFFWLPLVPAVMVAGLLSGGGNEFDFAVWAPTLVAWCFFLWLPLWSSKWRGTTLKRALEEESALFVLVLSATCVFSIL